MDGESYEGKNQEKMVDKPHERKRERETGTRPMGAASPTVIKNTTTSAGSLRLMSETV